MKTVASWYQIILLKDHWQISHKKAVNGPGPSAWLRKKEFMNPGEGGGGVPRDESQCRFSTFPEDNDNLGGTWNLDLILNAYFPSRTKC